jgi:hypothetical protein
MQIRRAAASLVTWLALVAGVAAQDAPAEPKEPEPAQKNAGPANEPSGAGESVCLMIESAAAANGLPLEFFARVIWQESRFNPEAVGPLTRSGERAQGIAQFMPRTAAERRLLDPFDPVQALPKSAEFLKELLGTFGNLGLAAAAYNAGPRRVRDWLAGRGALPRETQRYVVAVTGHAARDWAAGGGARAADLKALARPNCREVTALIKREPNVFVAELERRVSEGAARPWGVQLSAGFSRAKVLTIYAALERKYRAVLEGHDPSIIRARWLSRGTSAFYQVRVGAGTRAEADKLCSSLRAAGGPCLVLRNPAGAMGG